MKKMMWLMVLSLGTFLGGAMLEAPGLTNQAAAGWNLGGKHGPGRIKGARTHKHHPHPINNKRG